MDNLTKCLRCGKNFINEELESHVCNPRFTGVIQIGVVYWFEGKMNENGDKIIMAKGFDGKLYQLVHCTHNPPHQPTGNTDNVPTRKQNLIEGTVTLSVDFVDFSFCFLRLMNFRYRKINSIFDISICLIYFMREYLWIITVLVLSACIAIPFVIPFASFSISGEPNLVMNLDEIVYAVPFLALFVLAGMLLIKLKKHYLFVCGECDRCFLTEKDLRKHYGTIHIKKDSKEKKD